MRLSDWRKDQGYNQEQLADLLDVSQPTISYIERARGRDGSHPQVPQPDLMQRIWKVTRGAVAPNDFYDLPPIDQLELPDLVVASEAPLFAEGGDQ